MVAKDANWLDAAPVSGETLGVRIRHGAPIVEAVVEEATGESFRLDLPVPQFAVTPGQSAVLYRGRVVVGGGINYG